MRRPYWNTRTSSWSCDIVLRAQGLAEEGLRHLHRHGRARIGAVHHRIYAHQLTLSVDQRATPNTPVLGGD